MPNRVQKNTEVSTSDKVVIDSDQTPIRPRENKVMAQKMPIRLPVSCQPSREPRITPMIGGTE